MRQPSLPEDGICGKVILMNSVQVPVGHAAHSASEFNLRWQCDPVSRLLYVCVQLLPELPAEVAASLESAVRDFEKFAVPTAWSLDDVDERGERNLSDEQRRAVIDRFAKRCSDASDSDWSLLSLIVDEVVEEDAQSPV